MQLQTGITAPFRIVKPSQQKDGLIHFSDAGQCPGEPIRSAGVR
jgi:hypothetical protein